MRAWFAECVFLTEHYHSFFIYNCTEPMVQYVHRIKTGVLLKKWDMKNA